MMRIVFLDFLITLLKNKLNMEKVLQDKNLGLDNLLIRVFN